MTERVRSAIPAIPAIAAAAIALLLAAASLLPVHTDALLLGRPGDTSSLGRFYPSSSHLGATGRWTRGDGEIRLPGARVPTVVTLRLTVPDTRVPDTLQIVVNGVRVHTRTVSSAGWHDVDVDIDQRIAKDAIVLRLRSGVSPDGGGVPRGVFVERAMMTTGGFAALPRTRGATLFWLTLAWLGILICAVTLAGIGSAQAGSGVTLFGSEPTVGGGGLTQAGTGMTLASSGRGGEGEGGVWPKRLTCAALVVLAFAAVVGFRPALMPHIASVAGLCLAAAAAMTIALRASPAVERSPFRTAAVFTAIAAVLIALLFPEALKGRVLSQADMFYEHQPWASHMPADYRAPDRPPLKDVPMLVYPFAAFTQSRLRQGIFPLWTNAISAGQPFLATFQSSLLSPFTLVTAVVPLPHATVLMAMLRLMTAGLGMFLFLRAIGVSRLAAAFGGITFLLNPFLLVWLEHPLAGVPPWLPWMLLASERLAAELQSAEPGSAERLAAERQPAEPLAAEPRSPGRLSVERQSDGRLSSEPVSAERASTERLSTERWSASRRGRPAVGVAMLAVATALVLAGGHPHTGMFVAMLGGGYAIARAVAAERPRRVRTLLLTAAALALGTALVALQVLPFLEYVSLSRAAAARTDYPLNPFIAPASTLITAIVPNFLGHHAWGNFAGPTNYLEQQIYPGIAVWLLAAVGITTGIRAWRVWFFASAGLLAMLVMYGAPGIHELVSRVPLIKAASLPRAGIITLGALAVLSALGVDEILRARREGVAREGLSREGEAGVPREDEARVDATRRQRSGEDATRRGETSEDAIRPGAVGEKVARKDETRRGPIPIAAAASLGGGAIVLVAIAIGTLRARHDWLATNGLSEFTTRWTWLSVWLTAAVTAIALARLARISGRRPAGVALCGLVALDLLLFGRGFHPLIPAEQAFPVVPEIAHVSNDRDLFRVLGTSGSLMPNAAMVYGLQDVRGYDGLLVARYADLLDAAFRYEHHTHFATGLQSPLINLLNVKYVFAVPQMEAPDGWFTKVIDGDAPLYRNNRVFPRAFLVDGYVVQDGNPARRTLRDGRVDFRRVALLEQDLAPELRPSAAARPEDIGRATITSYGDQHVAIDTDAPDRRLLVLTDVHYPGWVAAIDGHPAPMPRANFAFRAVPVPAGRHTVTFDYRPSSFRIGLTISVAALVLLAAAVVIEHRRGRRASERRDERPGSRRDERHEGPREDRSEARPDDRPSDRTDTSAGTA